MMVVLQLWALLAVATSLVAGESFTNGWAAEVPKGRQAAEQVAKEAGCSLDEGEIIPGSNFYHFSCHHVRRRSTEPHGETHKSIEEHQEVVWAEQQVVKSRRKRIPEPEPEPQWGGFGGGFNQQQVVLSDVFKVYRVKSLFYLLHLVPFYPHNKFYKTTFSIAFCWMLSMFPFL